MDAELRDFLEIPYGKLEELNLAAKELRTKRVPAEQIYVHRVGYRSFPQTDACATSASTAV